MQPLITFEGRAARDPELRFTKAGEAVAAVTLAHTDRIKDPVSGEWTDGETMWIKVTVWRKLAEQITETVRKGDLVLVAGTLRQTAWTTKEGEARTTLEVNASSAALVRASAKRAESNDPPY